MSIIYEKPYVSSLKEEYLDKYCSSCLSLSTNRCSKCERIVYCNDQCQSNDSLFHQRECQFYCERKGKIFNSNEEKSSSIDLVIIRMIIRLISRLKIDNGQPNEDLCENLPQIIRRRSWKDLLSHRDEILQSDRHKNLWLKTQIDLQRFFPSEFDEIDLLEIFGKILINRFRVGIHLNVLQGRVAIGWAIYLTISGLNHCCEPDLYQCSFDHRIRLKLSKKSSEIEIPSETNLFYRLTLSYRHQNDFHPLNWISYVPRRNQRRLFLNYFFFNCHCSMCDDENRFKREEYLSNDRCSSCGHFLLLKSDRMEIDRWISICIDDRCSLSLNHKIHRRYFLSIESNDENSIEIDEKNFLQYEQIFHRHSLILIQMKEYLLHRYSKQNHFESIQRRIQLNEDLIEFYDVYFSSSSTNYPKVLLQNLSFLYQSIGEDQRAQFILDKAKQLWINDYQHHLDYRFLQL